MTSIGQILILNKKQVNLNETGINYDLLIIAPKEFALHLTPLVNHKNYIGVTTKLSTTDEIYTHIFWQGRDNAEKIKYFIKEAKEEWGIKYVLLVGGRKDQSREESWWIPVRYSYLARPYVYSNEQIIFEGQFLTDLYFADIYDNENGFSSWDDNDNGFFGEWPILEEAVDNPDLYPDVMVGRLPCRNINDVKNVVKKIINYETGKLDESWFKKMVVIAGDTYPEKTEYIDGEVYTQQALEIMSDFEPIKIWGSLGNLNTRNIVRAINQGCGFIFFSTHGGPSSTSTHPPYSNNWIGRFALKNMLFLFNLNKLPICTAGSGCFVSMFNASLSKTEWTYWNSIPYNIPYCWSWSLVRRPYGGCISVIGSTGFSYESPDNDRGVGGCEQLDIRFYEQYNSRNTHILGDCWGNAITSFLQNYTIDWSDTSHTGDGIIAKNCEQWLLIGDPSLRIGGYS